MFKKKGFIFTNRKNNILKAGLAACGVVLAGAAIYALSKKLSRNLYEDIVFDDIDDCPWEDDDYNV